MNEFVHLHVHSEYSLIDSTVRLDALIYRAAEQGCQAVAVTDICNLFGLVKFYKLALSKKIKPIIGAEIWLASTQTGKPPQKILLFCLNNQGYYHLRHLISSGYLNPDREPIPLITEAALKKYSEGLLAILTPTTDLAYVLETGEEAEVRQILQTWKNVFPNRLYLGISRIWGAKDNDYIQALIPHAKALSCPIVALNAVCFLNPEEYQAHQARVCICNGITLNQDKQLDYAKTQYFRSPKEMLTLFADLPNALQNSVEIAKRCTVSLDFGKNYLPTFAVPSGMTEEVFLRQSAEQGLIERLQQLYPGETCTVDIKKTYHDRLKQELDMIVKMGFPGYFLIVADFILWAKTHDIPVGPGRGSGAGSLVAYSLKITDVDPLAYDLLFERFLNPERVSMPDFDVDFCMDNRDKVIDYVAKRYGRQNVSQIVTFGTMAAKAVVRDVGRVLGHPYGFVDKIAKLIPFEIGITLSEALEKEEALKIRYKTEEEVTLLIDLAKQLEGLTRNVGKHAGGVVIAPSEIADFTPVYCESGSNQIVSQFDKDDVETIGLVKFDFLGLRTLTIIHWAIKTANIARKKNNEPPIDIGHIPLNDSQTFELLKACKTTAVFQLESRGMKDLIHRLQPDAFEEIIALVALFRPGPLQSGMVDDFINRKHGRAPVVYSHPALEPILKNTYGVILYQEQVMQIAQSLAGYTLGGADLLRRAMGKKKPEEMAQQREIFVTGATKNGVDPEVASSIFDLMEKFAGYGFNKSHSAAYALVSYQTAWLKAHYPHAFMAAVLSSDMNNTDKVVLFFEDAKNLGLSILSPDVNHSDYHFIVDENGKDIRYGLGAIKGAGEAAIASMVLERQQRGAFSDLFDFCRRLDTRKVNRRVMEALIKSGAMDCFGVNRATLFETLNDALHQAEQWITNQRLGQRDLFGNDATQSASYRHVADWPEVTRLLGEKETLGIYLTGHPIHAYLKETKQFIKMRLSDRNYRENQAVRVAGIVVQMRVMLSKRGDKIAFLTLDDNQGKMEVAVFSECYQNYQEKIVKDQFIIVEGQISTDKMTQQPKLKADKILSLEEARIHYATQIQIVAKQSFDVKALEMLLNQYPPGHCPIQIEYHTQVAKTTIALDARFQRDPHATFLADLKKTLPQCQIALTY